MIRYYTEWLSDRWLIQNSAFRYSTCTGPKFQIRPLHSGHDITATAVLLKRMHCKDDSDHHEQLQ